MMDKLMARLDVKFLCTNVYNTKLANHFHLWYDVWFLFTLKTVKVSWHVDKVSKIKTYAMLRNGSMNPVSLIVFRQVTLGIMPLISDWQLSSPHQTLLIYLVWQAIRTSDIRIIWRTVSAHHQKWSRTDFIAWLLI